MADDHCGSHWDTMMTVLIEGKKYINVDRYRYSSELSTIEYLDESPSVNEALTSWLTRLNEPRERSASLSAHYRNIGNDYHNNNADPDNLAADYFTRAIYSAPRDSVELAYAHANRAAALCRQSYSADEGYWDCECAIKFNYPKGKLCKLLQRKLSLGYASNRVDRIAETLAQIEELAVAPSKNFNLDAEKRKFEEYKQRMEENVPVASGICKDEVEHKKLIEKHERSRGRYIVAGESIKADELILRERAFAFVPVYNDYRRRAISHHCQNCAKTNCLPFPCIECCRASYCSPKCLDEHEPIHRHECEGYRKNLWIKIGIAHLAMRNLLVGFPSLMGRLKQLREATARDVWREIDSTNDANSAYGDVLSLVTNFDKMNRLDCLRYALTAKMLSLYLTEHTSFFQQLIAGEHGGILRSRQEWQTLVTGILMRHMGQLVCNGHAISDMEVLRPADYGDSYIRDKESLLQRHLYLCLASTRVFTAIFPRISILNHSCDPNIRNSFDGPYLTIYAARAIRQGEQVFNCYGPHYKLMDRDERQSVLTQQYCFECDCEKCCSDDRTIDEYFRYVCPNANCGAPIDLRGSVRQRWWLELNDERVCRAIASKFVCGKCHEKLFLNPHSLVTFASQALQPSDTSRRVSSVTRDLLSYYFAVAKCLGKHHELKQWMTEQIFSAKVDDDENVMSLAYAVVEYFLATRERHGVYSLEFVMATTYALKIIEIIRSSGNGCEKQKILKMLNVKHMTKAWSILPKSSQNYFKICAKNA